MGQPLYMGVWNLIFTLQPGKATADDKDAIPINQIVYMLDLLQIYNFIKEYKNIIKYSIFLIIKLGTWNIFLFIVDLDC